MVKSDGSDFSITELNDVLNGLRYFFAFVRGDYCIPSVVVGYDTDGQVTWGKAGRFEPSRNRPENWFNNSYILGRGGILEVLFPRFWCKWKSNRNELIAVVECYVHSTAMLQAGVVPDALAKSCSGLEILAGLVLGKTIRGNVSEEIHNVLRCYKIPNRDLDQSQMPITYALSQSLNSNDAKGAKLIVDVRNYVAHPLDPSTNAEIKKRYLSHVSADLIQYKYLHDLSQFYLEYMLLRFCGYNIGHYRQLPEQEH